METLKFYLTIACDNAAFEPGYINVEVARMLRHLADRLTGDMDHDGDEYTLRDINGNTVGRAVFDSVDRETSTV